MIELVEQMHAEAAVAGLIIERPLRRILDEFYWLYKDLGDPEVE